MPVYPATHRHRWWRLRLPWQTILRASEWVRTSALTTSLQTMAMATLGAKERLQHRWPARTYSARPFSLMLTTTTTFNWRTMATWCTECTLVAAVAITTIRPEAPWSSTCSKATMCLSKIWTWMKMFTESCTLCSLVTCWRPAKTPRLLENKRFLLFFITMHVRGQHTAFV